MQTNQKKDDLKPISSKDLDLLQRESEAAAANSKRRKMTPWNGKDEPTFEVETPWIGKE